MRILLAFVLALCATAASAQLYSWKDADGKTHYSDQPPPTATPTRKIAAPAARATDPAGTRKNMAEKELASRQKQKDAQDAAAKAEKDQTDADARRVNCERARANLQGLESGATRFSINAQGERIALDGAVREAELANARKSVESWCR